MFPLSPIALTVLVDCVHLGSDGWTPLHYAGSYGHTKVVKLLAEHKAYINATSKLHVPSLSDSVDWVRLDLKGQTPLHFAGKKRRTEVVNLLIELGANATSEGKLEVLCLLHNIHTLD
jgi:ankyrin repeat protein